MAGAGEAQLVAVTDADSARFRAACAIYETAIPRAEQKTHAQILASLAHPDVRFWAFERSGEVIGVSIVYAPRQGSFMLLEYLAVSPALQGRGTGSELFRASCAASRIAPDTVLLVEVDSEASDIDTSERAVRLRRKAFYRRLGCREVEGFSYILPLENDCPAPDMNLLVLGARGDRLETPRLRQAVSDLYQNVYACGPDDPRIAAMFARHGEALRLI